MNKVWSFGLNILYGSIYFLAKEIDLFLFTDEKKFCVDTLCFPYPYIYQWASKMSPFLSTVNMAAGNTDGQVYLR